MLNLGIVDCDSSHSIEFAKRINQVGVDREQFVHGARVICAVAGQSQMSPERVPVFSRQLADIGVTMLDSVDELLRQVDGVLLLSVSGQAHLDRVRPCIEARVPTFIDKPLSCSLEDAIEIQRLTNESGCLVWSCSAQRYSEDLLHLEQQLNGLGHLNGLVSHGPALRDGGNPGFFHYLIHAIEILYALMRPGCTAVSATDAEAGDAVTGVWSDGRIGTVRGDRHGRTPYGVTAFTDYGPVWSPVSTRFSYRNLCQQIVDSFESGQPGVPLETTLEIVRFILAGNRSAQGQSDPVALASCA